MIGVDNMPITKKKDGYYWGSRGPFKTRKKAVQVAQAAYASGYVKKSWKDILKSNRQINNFQLFLSDVFNIPREDSKNIKASKGLMQAISIGKFINNITEQEFYRLMSIAEGKRYQELINNLEELWKKSVKQRRREYVQKPEVRAKKVAYDKEYTQRPEVRERKIEYDRKRYQKIKEKREKEKREKL